MATLEVTPRGTVAHLDTTYDSLSEERLKGLADLLLDAAAKAVPPRLVVDMSQTEFIGSRFVEIVFRAGKRLAERGGSLSIAAPSRFCAEVLRVLELDQVFDIEPSVAEALDRQPG